MIDISKMTEALELANELSGKVEKLMELNNQAIESLPAEEKRKVAFVAKDINEVKKAVKKGDLEAITKLTQKYADNSKK